MPLSLMTIFPTDYATYHPYGGWTYMLDGELLSPPKALSYLMDRCGFEPHQAAEFTQSLREDASRTRARV